MAETQQTKSEGATETAETSDFTSLLNKQFKPQTDRARDEVESAVRTLAQQALEKTTVVGNDVVESINAMIAQIDKKMSEQINAIIHHKDFQQLESAWRGLHYLVNNTETDEMLKIRVMNISKKELHKTLRKFKGAAWDQSPIFKRLYEEEFGQLGGEPYGCLVGDYYFDHSGARRGAAGRGVEDRGRDPCAVHRGHVADPDANGVVAGAVESARPHQDLHHARIRGLAVAARVG